VSERPRLCFVGPMLGRNPGWVTTQGEVLADLFSADGWTVLETSKQASRVVRLLDTVSCLIRWRRSIDIVVLSVFSGRAFVMADVTSTLARLLRLPVVMVLHGGNLPTFRTQHPRWVQRVLRRAALLVAPSTFLARDADTPEGLVEIIPNVINLSVSEFKERSNVEPRLLWMRTFHPIYNPSLAVRVADRLRVRWPSMTLTMAGQEKGLTEAVKAEAHERELDGFVDFPGFLGPAEKSKAFDKHDIYLHTNHVDNTPVSLLEAAAAGLPIVATEVGGIPHLLEHEHTALLVPDDDDEAMAAAIERLLTEPLLADKLSRNGRALAERSAWPAVLTMWEQVLARVEAQRP
jgi:glycosyltransferase involved in cell wall biosynthesis